MMMHNSFRSVQLMDLVRCNQSNRSARGMGAWRCHAFAPSTSLVAPTESSLLSLSIERMYEKEWLGAPTTTPLLVLCTWLESCQRNAAMLTRPKGLWRSIETLHHPTVGPSGHDKRAIFHATSCCRPMYVPSLRQVEIGTPEFKREAILRTHERFKSDSRGGRRHTDLGGLS